MRNMPAQNSPYDNLPVATLRALAADVKGPARQKVEEALRKAEQTGGYTPTRGEAAYALLTPEQQTQIDANLAHAATEQKVVQATETLATATQSVVAAATQAQAVVVAAPESVDTTALEAAIAAVQPVIDASTPAAPAVPSS